MARTTFLFGVATVAVAGAALPAHAAFTGVNAPYPGEASHGEILSTVYGGTFSADGENFVNGSGVVATRIEDGGDELFDSSVISADARAVFADHDQSFGYIDGESGGSFTELFSVSGYGFGASGTTAGTSIEGPFRFARNGSEGILASSQATDNPDDADQMVTYLISGEGIGEPIYALFFEDNAFGVADRDFQDLVVEVRGIGATIIPTPAAFGAGLVMLGGAALRRRKA